MGKFYFSGVINDSGVTLDHQNAIIRGLPILKDKPLLFEVSILTNNRSLQQNRYLHGIIVPIICSWHKETQGFGITSDQAKAFIYTNILEHKIVITEILGTEVITFEGKHFSKMTTTEFADSVKKVQSYFDELDVYIPDPKPKNTLDEFIEQ